MDIKRIFNIANILTFARIILSIILIFFSPYTLPFMILYLVAGSTDMIDGFVARRLNLVSSFGSILDTLADFIFFVISCVKILPLIYLPLWLMIVIFIVALIKITNTIINYVKNKSIVVDVHSFFNKITGLIIFTIPIFIQAHIEYYVILVATTFAIAAAIDELCKIVKEKTN